MIPPAPPCLLVIFGAAGDLTRRLLTPALYNLIADGLLPERFALLGVAKDDYTDATFRDRIDKACDEFKTRSAIEPETAAELSRKVHYLQGDFGDGELYRKLKDRIADLQRDCGLGPNVLYYLATPPSVFESIARNLGEAGLPRNAGWARLVVEKPFGRDLASSQELNRGLLVHWREDQIFRIDHYLGKETVQNLLAFRFSNSIFEPLWNRSFIDNIQFTVAEAVGVEGRGGYYEKSGALRDMLQNHMFQMLAYLCMEPPARLTGEAVRDEKAKLLDAVRVWRPDEIRHVAVRGQYGPGLFKGHTLLGYRQEPSVSRQSMTETFIALKVAIDNWRWEGVPIYLRSGKRLWKRGTEIVVQFKRAPAIVSRDAGHRANVQHNTLVFHVQPDQGIEFRFFAKSPGPMLELQKVNMRFDYEESFTGGRGTGYEVLLYHVMTGENSLFTRADLTERAWELVQPILDAWQAPASDFPNYPAGSWGPQAAGELLHRDGRAWVEILNRTMLEQVPLFHEADPVLLHQMTMMLRPCRFSPGMDVVEFGDHDRQMYLISRGEVEVLGEEGQSLSFLKEGQIFGELSLLLEAPRSATVRARTPCDLWRLDQADFAKILREHPEFGENLMANAERHYPESMRG